ncbi:MAG: GNAT family N-acetyltransferase, partial [Candidatus Ratteibacteria bacterium]
MAEIDFHKLAALTEKDVIAWRRHFHQYPELSNKEVQTSQFIQNLLGKMGIPHRVAAGTGVIAEISGKNKKVIGFAMATTIRKPRSAWKYGYVVWLGVKRRYHRHGIGERL